MECREYVAFFERMRIEAQLFLFDGTALSRTAMMIASRRLYRVPLKDVDPQEAADHECKFREANADPAVRAGPFEDTVLVVGDGMKRFLCTAREATAIENLRDSVEFFFARAILHVNATFVPNNLVKVLAMALGEPARDVETREQPASEVPPAKRGTQQRDDDDQTHEIAAGGDTSTDSDIDGADDDDSIEIEVIQTVTSTEADLLTRAFGNIQWIERHLKQEEQPEATDKPAMVGPVTPLEDDGDDDDDDDVVVFAGGAMP